MDKRTLNLGSLEIKIKSPAEKYQNSPLCSVRCEFNFLNQNLTYSGFRYDIDKRWIIDPLLRKPTQYYAGVYVNTVRGGKIDSRGGIGDCCELYTILFDYLRKESTIKQVSDKVTEMLQDGSLELKIYNA